MAASDPKRPFILNLDTIQDRFAEALKVGKLQKAQAILKDVAELPPNPSGENPLHTFAQMNFHLMCKALSHSFPALAHGEDHFGHTPLMSASMAGHLETIEALTPFSDVNHQGLSGASALLLAASSGKADAMRMLMRLGANPLAITRHGSNMLHCACRSQKIEAIELALAYCNPETPNDNRLCPSDMIRKFMKKPGGASLMAAFEQALLIKAIAPSAHFSPRSSSL